MHRLTTTDRAIASSVTVGSQASVDRGICRPQRSVLRAGASCPAPPAAS